MTVETMRAARASGDEPAGPARRDLLKAALLTTGAAAAAGLVAPTAARAVTTRPQGRLAAPAAALLSTNDVGAIGDSITLQDMVAGLSGETGSGMTVFGPRNYLGWALPRTGGRFRFRGGWATGGYTTSQVMSIHLPKALASKAAVVGVLAGTNDIGTNVPLATIEANLTAITGQLLANGQMPVMCTLPPRNTGITRAQRTTMSRLNDWIRRRAASIGVPLADFNLVLTDPKTGVYYRGYDVDGVHPSSNGAYVMGSAFATAVNSIAGTAPSELLTNYSPTAMLKDVLIQGPQGGDPATWTVAGNSTGGGLTLTTGSTWVGNKGVVTRGAGDFYLLGSVSTPVPGHQIGLSFVLDASAVPTGGTWSVLLADLDTYQSVCGYYGMDHVLPGGIATWRFTVPATLNTAHRYAFMYYVQSVTGTVLGCAQVSIRDLTALGLA